MMRGKRRILILIVLVEVILGSLAVLSRATTFVYWDALIPEGTWIIYVKDVTGTPIRDAKVDLLSPETGKLAVAPSGPFDNYTGPGSVSSDSEGAIELRNALDLRYGGECWKLFWVWPIGDWPENGPGSLLLRILAPGYKPSTLLLRTLLSEDKLVVTLYKEAG
jgi:hypothetical protein